MKRLIAQLVQLVRDVASALRPPILDAGIASAVEWQAIERFLPAQMDEAQTAAAIEGIKVELGASGMKDMGRVMAELKARHGSELDMSKASAAVKAALN